MHLVCLSGVFSILQCPDFVISQSLSIFQSQIDSVCISPNSRTVAFAGRGNGGQLFVWDIYAESYLLKQQGHQFGGAGAISVVAYGGPGGLGGSSGSSVIATGSDDGKIKLWDAASKFCFLTLSEHSGPITSLCFAKEGRILLSASSDGSIRAWDLIRYKNFKTMILPQVTPGTLSSGGVTSLCTNPSGDIVLAACWDTFQIYVYSVRTGSLVDVLSGHEAPITGLAFDPLARTVVSGSLDSTVRFWNLYGESLASETSLKTDHQMQIIQMNSQITALSFRPDGKEVAVATLNGQVSFYNPETLNQVSTVLDASKDLDQGRRIADKRTAKNNPSSKYFSCLSYSSDSNILLAGGNSKTLCLYDTAIESTNPLITSLSNQRPLLKRLETCRNMDLDGILEKLNSGFDYVKMFNARREAQESEDRSGSRAFRRVPGALKGDLGARTTTMPVMQIKNVSFSPDNQSFALVSTEGLLVYALDESLFFEPLEYWT